MKVVRLLGLLASLAVVAGCGRRSQPAPAAHVATAAETASPATAAAPAAPVARPYPKVGVLVALPADWEEATPPAEFTADDLGAAVSFRKTGTDLRLTVSGTDNGTYTRIKRGLGASGSGPKMLAGTMKQALLQDKASRGTRVVEEKAWSGQGAEGWRIRAEGTRPETGRTLGDLIVAEGDQGGMFLVLAEAHDEAGLAEVGALLEQITFEAPPAPAESADSNPAPAPSPGGAAPRAAH